MKQQTLAEEIPQVNPDRTLTQTNNVVSTNSNSHISKRFLTGVLVIMVFLFIISLLIFRANNSSQMRQVGISTTISVKWLSYQNPMYHYSFQYPANWKLDDHMAQLTPDPGFPCPTSNITLTSPEGYIFDYNNDQCLGDQPEAVVKQINVIVDNISLVKSYVNRNCGTNINEPIDKKIYPQCQTG